MNVPPRHERSAPVPARMRAWLLAAVVCAATGCRGEPEPPAPAARNLAPDEGVMLALDCYNPLYQLDRGGRVTKLKLNWQHIARAEMAEVGKLTELRSIDLAYSTVDDEGLAELKALRKLRSIGLGGTSITDDGLDHLEKMTGLQYVWLPKQSVTAERVEKLKEARPDLNVYLQ